MGGWNRVLVLSLLLACAVAPAVCLAGENPKFAVPKPPAAVAETPTMEEWLRRLAGRFEYDGVANPYAVPPSGPPGGGLFFGGGGGPPQPRPVSGRSDCIHVGGGPGVQCVLDVKWREEWSPSGVARPPHPNLSPAMMLFGFEPGKARLHFLQVDNKGIAQGGTGVLSGNTARLATDPPRNGNVGVSRIYAPAHGRFIQVWVSAKGPQGEGLPNLVFTMRRITPDEAGEPSGMPPAQPEAAR